MATVSDLLAEAVAPIEAPLQTPAPTVAPINTRPLDAPVSPSFGPEMPAGPRDPNALSQYNLAAGRLAGLPEAVATDAQRQLAYDPSDILRRRNGDFEGRLMAVTREAAERAVAIDNAQRRSWGELVGDSASNAGQAFVGGFGSIAALGTSLVNDRAGAALSTGVENFNQWMDRNESYAGQARQRLAQGRNALRTAENDRRFDEEVASGTTEFRAGLNRIGRGVLDGVVSSLEDPATTADMVAQGIGSLFGGGAISKTLTGIARAVLPASVSGSRIGRAATGMSASIGLQEGAGAYQQVVNQVLQTPYVQLERESPEFRRLLAETGDAEQARIALANQAGRLAAAIQAPLAAVTARVTGAADFEAAPLTVREGLRGIARNLLREGGEEAIQGGTGEFAQNVGVQTYANENQGLTSGVGEGIGSGAVAGLLTAGALQAPGGAARVAAGGAARVTGAISDALASRPVPVATSTVEPDPVPPNTAAPAAEGTTSAPTPPPTPRTTAPLSRAAQAIADGFGATVDAINQAPRPTVVRDDVVETPPTTPAPRPQIVRDEEVSASPATTEVFDPLSVIGEDNTDSASGGWRSNVTSTITRGLRANGSVRVKMPDGSIETIVGRANREWVNDKGQPVNTVDIAPIGLGEEGFKPKTKATLTKLPTTENDIGVTLKQEEDGNVSLTDEQRSSLKTSYAVLKADREAAEKLNASGIPLTGSQTVSQDILSNQGERRRLPSAAQHVQGISEAFRSQDYDSARKLMERMRNFVQHMNNKVAAVNAHLANNTPKENLEEFQAFDGKDKFFKSGRVIGVNPRSEKSLAVVQRMEIEAAHLAEVYNGLVGAYPTLAAEPIEAVSLVPRLKGKPSEIVRRTNNPAAFEASQGDAVAEAEVAAQRATEAARKQAETDARRAALKTRTEPTNDERAAQQAYEEGSQRNAEDRRTIEDQQTGRDRPARTAPPATPPVAAAPAPTGLASVFPNLIGSLGGKVRDFFTKAYTLSPTQVTRYAGQDSPLQYAMETLESLKNWISNVGDKHSIRMRPEVIDAYSTLLATRAPQVRAQMEKNLLKFMNKKRESGADKGKTNQERLLDGTWINGMVEGKVLNLVEIGPDGVARYNDTLIESSILAGLHWLINLSTGYNQIDRDAAQTMLGREASDAEVNLLNNGIHSASLVRSLAQRLPQYWGLKTNKDADLGMSQGIAEAMAIEIITAFTQIQVSKSQGVREDAQNFMLNVRELTLETTSETGVDGVQVFNMYQRGMNFEEGINQFPNAIEEASLVEPTQEYFYEDDAPPVPTRQLRNSTVKLSSKQKLMAERASNVKFSVNTQMANFYQALTRNGFRDLFGNGDLEGRILNESDRESLDGQNRSLMSAYDSFTNQMLQINSIAAATGKAAADVTMRFAFGVTRVGRLMMLGGQNPQSTKAIREVFLSTWATLNMTTAKHQELFTLALGQALGVKIHQMTRADVKLEVDKRLAALSPVVDLLGSIDGALELEADQIQMIKDTFKKADIPVSPLAIHALVEQGKLDAATDKTKFRTSLYVEADGVTNGVVNAIMMLTSGAFDATWKSTMAKGGLLFRESMKTMNMLHTKGTKEERADIYTAVRDKLNTIVSTRWKNTNIYPGVEQQFEHLKEFMGILLPDVQINTQTGEITFTRGVTKNPVTITLYGSGANGIAGKMVKLLEEQIASKMSLYAEARARQMTGADLVNFVWAEESKGNPNIAEEFEARFSEQLERLTSTMIITNPENGGLYVGKVRAKILKPLGTDPLTFELTPERKDALRSNMRHLFVDPMRDAIKVVIGQSLLNNAETLRMATQVQSIFLQAMFQELVQEKLAIKKAVDPNFMSSHFLTQAELDTILDELKQVSPNIQGIDQEFFLAGTASSEAVGTEFARGLEGNLRTPGTVFAPRNIGVGGVPVLNIAYGDGRMILEFMTSPGSVDGVLPIYDGINMPLTSLESLSVRANKAVWESWKGNPILDASASYQTFLQGVNEERIGDSMVKALTRAIYGRTKDKFTNDMLMEDVQAIGAALEAIGVSVRLRTLVTSQVKAYVDQMASAGASYETPGTISLDNVTDEDALIILNNKLDEVTKAGEPKKATPALIEIPYAVPTPQSNPEAPVEAPLSNLNRMGKKLASGARKISPKNLAKLFQTRTDIPGNLRDVLRDLFLASDLEGYSVVYGTPEQLNDYQRLVGDEVTPFVTERGVTKGVTATGSKTIYLHTPTAETFTHEVVHAATFTRLLAMIEGKIDNEASRAALESLRSLAAQFLTMESVFLEMGVTAHQNYVFATSAMLGAQNEAVRLNEFMAWALANQQLAEGLRATPATKTWMQAALDAVKQLIFGRKRLTTPENNMFSQLRFTSQVIMRTQPTVAEQASKATLFMSTLFGTDERLNKAQDLFDGLFLKFANEPKTAAGQLVRRNDISRAVFDAQVLARQAINAGFVMTMQEKSLFQNIVAAFATTMKINPSSVAEIEANYRHVMSKLKIEDFMADPTSLDPNIRANATKLYDLLAGNVVLLKDKRNRSSLMPVFLGLAVVNPELRAVLEKIPTRTQDRDSAGTVDAHLDNLANNSLRKLSDSLSGTKGTNIQQAIDAIVDNIAETTEQKLSFIEKFGAPVGRGIDWMNEQLVYGITTLSEKVIDKTNGVTTTNPYAGFLVKTVRLVAKLATEKRAAEVSLGLMHAINQGDSFKSVREFFADFVGRTNENAKVYDLIKTVKTAVSQMRQTFREQLPQTIRESFTRKLTEQEWTTLYRVLAKTDLATLLGSMTRDEVLRILTSDTAIRAQIAVLEREIRQQDPAHFDKVKAKSEQLATYMMGGPSGQVLLRNAESVARLHMVTKDRNRPTVTRGYVEAVDALITLYAVEKLSPNEKTTFRGLMTEQAFGLDFSFAYMKGQRHDEVAKANGKARFNALKGFISTQNQEAASLEIANKTEGDRLLSMGYEKIADYKGSSLDPNSEPRAYYYAPVNGKAAFNQGVFQNVRETSGGVDTGTGFTYHGMTAGIIADPREVADITRALARGNAPAEVESLIPVIGVLGVPIAYERGIDSQHLSLLKQSTNFADMLGVWVGRQAEERVAMEYNIQLNQALFEMWQNEKTTHSSQFVNIFDSASLDPVIRDAVNLMTHDTRKHAESLFGKDTLMVRRDMLNDALGYRKASVGDLWTGVSRLRPETQKVIRELSERIVGRKAYVYAVNAERIIQNVVNDARVLIVVKSVIVPTLNVATNVLQLVSRGVPLMDIYRGVPRKLSEIDLYTKTTLRKISLEAQLRASNPFEARKLENEIQSINDTHRRLSIWPLIQAGEFSTISDAGVTFDDTLLSEGKFGDYIEKKVNELPEGVRNFGRQAIITRDTSLFQGLQKSVAYGDFIFKAILYDHLTGKKGKLPSQALAQITEEFVHYDRLPGRGRGYLEDMGLLWFYNYKIRFMKVALSIVRRNPVQALFAAMIPIPFFLGNIVDLPTEGALFMKAYDGKLEYSMGPGQGLSAINLHPLVNILS